MLCYNNKDKLLYNSTWFKRINYNWGPNCVKTHCIENSLIIPKKQVSVLKKGRNNFCRETGYQSCLPPYFKLVAIYVLYFCYSCLSFLCTDMQCFTVMVQGSVENGCSDMDLVDQVFLEATRQSVPPNTNTDPGSGFLRDWLRPNTEKCNTGCF